jgi:hypothetical protein
MKDRILQTCSSFFARVVDEIAYNPTGYLEELLGLSQTKRAFPVDATYRLALAAGGTWQRKLKVYKKPKGTDSAWAGSIPAFPLHTVLGSH